MGDILGFQNEYSGSQKNVPFERQKDLDSLFRSD